MMIKGCDISFWQGEINFRNLEKENKFVGIRVGQGAWIDSQVRKYAAKVSIPHLYYWFYEYRSGYQNNPDVQFKLMNDLLGEIGEETAIVCLDYERPNTNWEPLPSRENSLNIIEKFGNKFYKNKKLIYGNLDLLKNTLRNDIPDWVKQNFDFWLAYYPSTSTNYEPKLTDLPLTVWKPTIWQYGYKTAKDIASGSSVLDADVFPGDFDTFFSIKKWYQLYLPFIKR
jgi:GH25 family lysozyme M1 (1,4-beta-N-acetylmuramidase)